VEQIRVFRAKLPVLLAQLSEIPDYRNPKKIKHKLTVVLIYGILVFVYQMASRREANKMMTRPAFMESLRLLFPDLEKLPHHDTLGRILEKIDVNRIEEIHVESTAKASPRSSRRLRRDLGRGRPWHLRARNRNLAPRLALQQTAEPEKRTRTLQLGSASPVGNREWDPRGETPRL
jgi:hypothetical protein